MANFHTLHPKQIRDLSPEALDKNGRLKVLPASFWAATTVQERGLFGHTYGFYNFPTVELVKYLSSLIGDRRAIEIGAGHGALADALGILPTDSRIQEKAPYRQIFEQAGQPIIRYGSNVIECNAVQAVRRFKPQAVVGCWVTHKFNQERAWAGGFIEGINEEKIIKSCEMYIFMGNEEVHANKSIWSLPHTIEYPDFVYSRAQNGRREFIATWQRSDCF